MSIDVAETKSAGRRQSCNDVDPVDVLLSDGGIATIRPVVAEDRSALLDLHARGSDLAIQRRFLFLSRHAADGYVRHVCSSPRSDVLALVAERDGEIVGLTTCERTAPDAAEVSFFIDDHHQRRGLGTLLLAHLAAWARIAGIAHFTAVVSATNTPMVRVFRDAGFAVKTANAGEVIEVTLRTDASEQAVAAAGARERSAATKSLDRVLSPRVVAVIGAGRRPGGVGRTVLENIVARGFRGSVYAIHPEASEIAGVPAFAHVCDVPEAVDLVVVAVPAAKVVSAVADAAAAGVKGAVVLTSGLGEGGSAGASQQREMVRVARRHGMRIIGPNCLGLLNTDPTVHLDATFAAVTPPAGRLAVASQSGGVGIALLDSAARADLGVGVFVSLGNKADVSSNDLLEAWTDDARVGAVALYLESFGNPRKFARVAHTLSSRKPLLAVVGGRSESGQRAGASHTAAAAAPTVAVDALFAQSGVIGVASVQELTDTARVLLTQPLPEGPRLAVIGNAGGLGVLAADAAHTEGLVVPQFSADLHRRLGLLLSGAAGLTNPVDLGAAASPASFDAALREIASSAEVDAIVVVFAATRVGDTRGVLAAIADASTEASRVAVVSVLAGVSPEDAAGATGVPVFDGGDNAVRALANAQRYAHWRAAPPSGPTDLHDLNLTDARAVVAEVLDSSPDGRWLRPDETARMLASYAMPTPSFGVVRSARQATLAARSLGYPLVAKVADLDFVHKSDRGLVAVGLRSAADVTRAYRRFAAILDCPNPAVLVQQQVEAGVELALGVVHDPAFGPLVMVAAGGVAIDILDDRAFLMLPVTRQDAARAVGGLRAAPLLRGFRGAPATNLAALEDLIVRVGRLARDVPEIAEMDLNPVMVTPEGVCCVDAKIRVRPHRAVDDAARPSLRSPA